MHPKCSLKWIYFVSFCFLTLTALYRDIISSSSQNRNSIYEVIRINYKLELIEHFLIKIKQRTKQLPIYN